MKHFASPEFWEARDKLTAPVRAVADKNFVLLKANPKHPSLHLKKIGALWSVRAGRGHRALAREVEGGLLWFWIGPHSVYNQLLK